MQLRSIFVFALCAVGGALAADENDKSRVGSDVFISGGTVTVDDAVGGDLFAAGGTVDVDAAVAGDAVAAGGKLRLGAEVGQSVYAAGGQVNVNAKVGRNLRVAGGRVELGPKADVAGNVSMAGGQLRLHGAVRGHVQAAGGRLLINGPVGGDVLAMSGQVELGPQARIAGKLRYRSGEALRQDPGAQVSGGIELLVPAWGEAASRPPAQHPPQQGHGFGWAGWFWTAGLIVLAALWLGLAPRTSARSSQMMRERLGLSVGARLHLAGVRAGADAAVVADDRSASRWRCSRSPCTSRCCHWLTRRRPSGLAIGRCTGGRQRVLRRHAGVSARPPWPS